MSIVREADKSKWALLLTGTLVSVCLIGGLSYHHYRARFAPVSDPGVACENGLGAAKAYASSWLKVSSERVLTPAGFKTAWIPRINDSKPPTPAPEGMTWIPGGQFWMGTADERMADARPWHGVYVDGYWMDKTEVTNEQFARFVKATGYVTVAERNPRAEDYPQALPEKLVAGSVAISPPDRPVELDNHFRWWNYLPGAS